MQDTADLYNADYEQSAELFRSLLDGGGGANHLLASNTLSAVRCLGAQRDPSLAARRAAPPAAAAPAAAAPAKKEPAAAAAAASKPIAAAPAAKKEAAAAAAAAPKGKEASPAKGGASGKAKTSPTGPECGLLLLLLLLLLPRSACRQQQTDARYSCPMISASTELAVAGRCPAHTPGLRAHRQEGRQRGQQPAADVEQGAGQEGAGQEGGSKEGAG